MLAIVSILTAMFCISLNDALIKFLSGDYPLHQLVFVRSAIGISFTLVLVQMEGGWGLLKTEHPWLHGRGLLVVTSNMTYFAALAVLPLATIWRCFLSHLCSSRYCQSAVGREGWRPTVERRCSGICGRGYHATP